MTVQGVPEPKGDKCRRYHCDRPRIDHDRVHRYGVIWCLDDGDIGQEDDVFVMRHYLRLQLGHDMLY